MIQSDIRFAGGTKQNAFFSSKNVLKNAPTPKWSSKGDDFNDNMFLLSKTFPLDSIK